MKSLEAASKNQMKELTAVDFKKWLKKNMYETMFGQLYWCAKLDSGNRSYTLKELLEMFKKEMSNNKL